MPKYLNSKVLRLLLIGVFLSGFQGERALAAGEIDIASMEACPVSLQSIWSKYGVPHPCFTNGSALKVLVPTQKGMENSTRAVLNGESFDVTAGTFFTIPNYISGLNEISFQSFSPVTNESFEFSTRKFIIYQAVSTLRLRTVAITKTAYAITPNEGIAPSQIVDALGIGRNEYIVKSLKGGDSNFESTVLVADLSEVQFTAAATSSLVLRVSKEGVIRAGATQSNATWGLDRIDQITNSLDGSYNYNYTGTGVDVYIIDTGLVETHTEFIGRVTDSAYLDNLGSAYDCNGHGTHVAGTAAGTTYGVAKSANIIPVRILNCAGEGSLSDVQSAVTWIANRHTDSTPAVANFSLGGGYHPSTNAAMQTLIDDGVVTVVAAGNDGVDACNYSPASAPNAITVGATTTLDQDARFSNVGSCVDIFAPGVGITSAWHTSNTATATISGTSMASPHVAGAAALVLEKNFASYSNKLIANAQVRATLLNNATPDILRDSYGFNLWWNNTTNKMLYTGFFSSQTQSSLQITNSNLLIFKDENLTLTTSGGSGSGAVLYKAKGAGCNISGNTLVITTKRTCAVTAIKASDDTYAVAQSAYVYFTTERPQSPLVVSSAASSGALGTPIALTTSGGSGTGALSYSVVSGACKVLNGKLLAYNEGVCGLTATKAADSTYLAATSETSTFTFTQALSHGPWKSVSTGGGTTCAITKSSGQLYCWGLNDFGQIAQPSNAVNSTPILVNSIPGRVSEVSVSAKFVCAVNSFSDLYCWGDNTFGQLGRNSTLSSFLPESVTTLASSVKSVSTGGDFACAVTLDGRSYCWGKNSMGQLGNGTLTDSLVPSEVSGLSSNTTQISAGESHACAVQSGALKCWGNGGSGALGDGLTTSSTTPVNVTGLSTGALRATSGFNYSCAMKATESYCWGENASGSIGDGSTINRGTPVILPESLTTLSVINSGYKTSCATTKSGELSCWGLNSSGQVGNNSLSNSNQLVPIAVLGMREGITSVESSELHSCAIAKYGRLFCWGNNSAGQLGIGETTTSITPYQASLLDYNLDAPRTPTFLESSTVRSAFGFLLPISNFDASYSWGAISSNDSATVTVSQTGVISVIGLMPSEPSTVTAYSLKNGFETGTATSSTIATLARGLIPGFDTSSVISTDDGFEINLANHDSNYQWAGVSSRDSATVTISVSGRLIVTGISPGTASTVTVTSSRNGYSSESSTSLSYTSNLGAGLLPIIDSTTAVATGDGFQVDISNYDSAYTWSGLSTVESGTVLISNVGRVTVTGIAPSMPSQVVVTAERFGYNSRTETSTAVISLPAGLLATMETSTPTANGFTLTISNFNNLYNWSAVSNLQGATAVIDANGLVTVTGVPAGTASRVIITTSRTGYGTVAATSQSVTSIPPPAPPAPSPTPVAAVSSGGGGVGTTWFNLFISSPDDPIAAYSAEACALFTLKSADGDKQFGPICAAKFGALDYEANDGDYLIRTFDKAFPKFFKEYRAKVTFGTFEVTGAGYRGGSVARRVLTVLKSSEYPVEPVVAPTPTPSPIDVPNPIAATSLPVEATVTPSPSASTKAILTMANNGSISTAAKTSTTKKMTLTSNTSSLAMKKSGTVVLSVDKIPTKSALSVIITLPSGEKITAASIKSYSKNTYSMPALAFSKSGNYTVTFKIGKSFKTVKIKVS